MEKLNEPSERICKVVGQYARGLICPSEMWMQIAESLTLPNATAVLEGLPREIQEKLQRAYEFQPPAAYIDGGPDNPGVESFKAACIHVIQWCERDRALASKLQSDGEPDGLIRVMVKEGKVLPLHPFRLHVTAVEYGPGRHGEGATTLTGTLESGKIAVSLRICIPTPGGPPFYSRISNLKALDSSSFAFSAKQLGRALLHVEVDGVPPAKNLCVPFVAEPVEPTEAFRNRVDLVVGGNLGDSV